MRFFFNKGEIQSGPGEAFTINFFTALTMQSYVISTFVNGFLGILRSELGMKLISRVYTEL